MKVICAVDGSEFSQWAIEAIGALGRSALSSVTLLHVLDTRHLKPAGAPHVATYRGVKAAMDKSGDTVLRRASGYLETALSQSAKRPRTDVRTLLLHGSPASTIVQRATQDGSDLIVLGTRGMSDIKGFLLGSVARKIASLAPCPVLIVKHPMHQLRRVLLAVDDSKHSRKAAKFLRAGLLPETAEVTVFSSVASPFTDLAAEHLSASQRDTLVRPQIEQAERLVAGIRQDFLKEGYAVVSEVQQNHVVDHIIKRADAGLTDLLVVGARGLSNRERLELGSVSDSLLRHAPCSILVVRGARG
ncbi:MAG: universal stress protein [Nitrospira sp.]|nr:universal stress protein [Nitrospira sp.]